MEQPLYNDISNTSSDILFLNIEQIFMCAIKNHSLIGIQYFINGVPMFPPTFECKKCIK